MILTLENINFCYKNATKELFKHLNLHIEDKKIIAIMGASGSGKSTLLRIIAGLETPQSGAISLNNTPLFNEFCNIPTEQRNIGMVFQNYILFPHMTVWENIYFGLGNIKKLTKEKKIQRCQEIIELIELQEFQHSYPATLSGGQQQRVALGRALAPMPQLLLLDEPFSNLDSFLRKKIRQELKDILHQAQITSILVTHNVADLQIADHIILIGTDVIKSGSLNDLREDKNCPLVHHLLTD